MEYENAKFWEYLFSTTSPETLNERLVSEEDRLKEFLGKDYTNVFSTWLAFFSVSKQPNVKLFSWLLSLCPEVVAQRCPFPVSSSTCIGCPKRSFNGCTLLHMMLLLRPNKNYFEQLSHTLSETDSEGNSALFYAMLSGYFGLYKHVWSLTVADGESAQAPGPQTALILVKADWMPWMKRECDLKQLIKVLGGLDPAIKACLQVNASGFTKIFMTKYGVVAYDKYMRQAIAEPGINVRTLVAVLEAFLQTEKKSYCDSTLAETILKRIYAGCQTFSDFKLFLRLTRTLKEQCFLSASLDELVAFTGSPYELIRLYYAYPTVMKTVNKARNVRPEVFDLRSQVFGSYLHIICKRIGEYEPFTRSSMHNCSLKFGYLPELLDGTRAEHWRVKDAQGKLPIEYLKPVLGCVDIELVEEMQRRSDI